MQQIWTFQFLEVVWQHILGVMDNVIYRFRFIGNLTGFTAVKELWKSVRFDEIIVTRRCRVFLGHSIYNTQNLLA